MTSISKMTYFFYHSRKSLFCLYVWSCINEILTFNFVGVETASDIICNISPENGHILTYEDKEGDWMMVGDVPWE